MTAQELGDFCKSNGIQHIRVSPHHPSSNGLAERAVQVFKQGMKKATSGIGDRVARLLFHYRMTPHTTTGLSPSEMLLGRKLRSRLDLLKPDIQQKVMPSKSLTMTSTVRLETLQRETVCSRKISDRENNGCVAR